MPKETFYIDGIDASTYGIILQRPISFSDPVPIVVSHNVPGRNGNLIYETGAFKNRIGKASCFCLGDDVEMQIRAVNNFLFSSRGYRRLETSDDPYHFWLARVSSGAMLEQRLRKLAPFEITFDCKPQRFLKSGEVVVNSWRSSEEENYIYNPTGFDAKPTIKAYGPMEGGLIRIGDYKVYVSEECTNSPIVLDCDSQNAYGANTNLNKYINAPEFPILVPGRNEINVEGFSTLEIIPRWWEL